MGDTRFPSRLALLLEPKGVGRVLVELSVVEQRYQAVLAVLDGVSVVEVASRFEVGRQTVHRWLRRYEDGGLAALADRSHRPAHSPQQMPALVEAQILEWRRRHPGWGPRRLAHEAVRAGLSPLPSRSGTYRSLRRHGLIEARPRRRRSEDWRRWERGAPMELWQFDVVGGIGLADGTELKALTGLDDHSCAGRLFASPAQAQAELDAWVEHYNTARPHQGIGMATPVERFDRARPADERAADLRAAEDRGGDDWVTRRFAANGVICVAYQQLSVGKHRAGEVVDVHLDGGLLQVWHRSELLKTTVRTDIKGGPQEASRGGSLTEEDRCRVSHITRSHSVTHQPEPDRART